MGKKNEFFRANTGAVIIDERGQVLAFKRADIKDHAWQLPQGGLKQGEDPLHAVYREIEEETSITSDKLNLIAEYPQWLIYELPAPYRSGKAGRGQAQKWYLFRFSGSVADIGVDNKEFSTWQWMDFEDLLTVVVNFRRPVYKKLLEAFGVYFSK